MGSFDYPVEQMDCSTGQMIVRPPTPDEVTQREKDAADAPIHTAIVYAAALEAEDKKATVLAHLSTATGLTPEEIRGALNA